MYRRRVWLSVSKCQLDVHPRVYPSFRVFGACSGAFWLVLMLRGHLPFWLFLSYERAFFSPLEGVWESWRVFSVPSVLKSHRVSWWEPCCCVVYWPIQTNDVCPSGLSHFGYYYWDSFLLVTVMSLFCLFFFFFNGYCILKQTDSLFFLSFLIISFSLHFRLYLQLFYPLCIFHFLECYLVVVFFNLVSWRQYLLLLFLRYYSKILLLLRFSCTHWIVSETFEFIPPPRPTSFLVSLLLEVFLKFCSSKRVKISVSLLLSLVCCHFL